MMPSWSGGQRRLLARASDVSFSTIKRIFRDPYQPVGVDTLHKIAQALGVSTAELIEDVPVDHKP